MADDVTSISSASKMAATPTPQVAMMKAAGSRSKVTGTALVWSP